MSGGVDSTVAALLLSEQGWRVHGFFMRLPLPGRDAQLQRVREVADRLAVPLTMIDLEQPFTDRVIRSFVDSYRAGLTPNPCIHCNEQIKFGLLAEAMRAAGMDRVATGHYARLVRAGGRARGPRAERGASARRARFVPMALDMNAPLAHNPGASCYAICLRRRKPPWPVPPALRGVNP